MMQNDNSGRSGEQIKELLKAALQYGRSLQSPQTGFIHHTYHTPESEVQHCIPLSENVLFCLLLFRSGMIENISEAKKLLDRLLYFQNDIPDDNSRGNFPVYLHSYPECSDRYSGIFLLSPFYLILKHFGHVMGPEIKSRVKTAVRKIFLYSARTGNPDCLPDSVAVRLAASKQAFGALLNDVSMQNEGESTLTGLFDRDFPDSFYSTECLADVMSALQIVCPSVKEKLLIALHDLIGNTWHRGCSAYIGPCTREKQKGAEPKVGLYDFFLGYHAGSFSCRAMMPAPILLQSAVLYPFTAGIDIDKNIDCNGKVGENRWNLVRTKEWACTLIEKHPSTAPREISSYAPLRLVWGDASRAHTLVCQNIDASKITFENQSPVFTLFFYLEQTAPSDDKDKQREVNFYLDYDPLQQISVGDSKASTFRLGQAVIIRSGDRTISLELALAEGDGQFLGHIMRGNRPSQTENKGENRFASYDWHIFLRTIRRTDDCTIKATVTVLS